MLNTLSATEQAALLRAREVSARDVLEAHIFEIERRNSAVNAFVTLDIDGARRQADALDTESRRGQFAGPLHGLTMGIKDSVPVAGLRCTSGSLSTKEHRADVDAVHVSNLRAAGAIVLGKTNLPELGHGRFGGQTNNLISGLTRNPWNTEMTVSSSSGGSAAALAANFVSLADGSDVAGSIRGPAAWCGLYGLRPTSGVVPHWPKVDPLEGTDVVGPMARTASDLALMFDAMRSPRKAPFSDVPDLVTPDWNLRGLRAAWCMKPDGSNTCEDVIKALTPLREVLTRAGAVVEQAEPDLAGLHAAQATLRSFGLLVKHGERIQTEPELFSPEVQASLARGQAVTAEELCQAMRVRDRAIHCVTAFFSAYDVMVWPTSTQLPFPADADASRIHEDWTPIELTPVLQLPALAVPVGTTPDGMPCGVQFIGPKRSDLRLMELAQSLEPEIGFVGRCRPGATSHPPE